MPRRNPTTRRGVNGQAGRSRIDFLNWLDDNPTPTSVARMSARRPPGVPVPAEMPEASPPVDQAVKPSERRRVRR